jgi:hypothetical protein
MTNLESVIQTGVVAVTTTTVVVVIIRAFLAERRDRSLNDAEVIGNEICPHCGQDTRIDGSRLARRLKMVRPSTRKMSFGPRPGRAGPADQRILHPGGFSACQRSSVR